MSDDCNECAEPVTDTDAAPSCGAHTLHIHCAPWFHCRHCYRERRELRMWVA